MNTTKVAECLVPIIKKSNLPDKHPEYGKDHLLDMVEKIKSGIVKNEKSHRWIGWIQGCICMGKGATLDELKLINKKHNENNKITDEIMKELND